MLLYCKHINSEILLIPILHYNMSCIDKQIELWPNGDTVTAQDAGM
jgi:hypothetical protein